MVIDTSAIIAAVTDEPDNSIYRSAIKSAPSRLISAVTLLETEIVIYARYGSNAVTILRELIQRAEISVVPFDSAMAELALGAFARYGKGRGHKAQLNILDCAAYALAKSRDLPLLFKGNDFAQTDIRPAVPQR